MGWNFLGTDWHLFGKLADVALLTLLFAATVMFFYIQRLRDEYTQATDQFAKKAIMG